MNIDNHNGIVRIKNGQVYHEGNAIDYSDMPDAILRFEAKAGINTFMSQAFLVL